MENTKACSKCGQTKSLTSFYKSKNSYYAQCKLCHKAACQKWQQQNSEKVALYHADWQRENKSKVFKYNSVYKKKNSIRVKQWRRNWSVANNDRQILHGAKRRAIKSLASVSVVGSKDITKLLNSKCLYCEKPSEHIEHILPLSRGGTHSLGNLAGACRSCNLSKKDKTVMEWRLWRKRTKGETQAHQTHKGT